VIEFEWLRTCRFKSLVKHEYNWDAVFAPDANIRIECLWRLLESGRIILTSNDDGHSLGLPAPRDAVAIVNQRIGGAQVTSINCNEGTLDLAIGFANGHVLEILPNSSCYEAWHLAGRNSLAIAVGGGSLDLFRDPLERGG
jgi:hypothetical protein